MSDTAGAPLSGVSKTALGAAMMRAEESARRDRLFDDPYASAFVAAAPEAFADGPDPGDPEVIALTDAFRSHIAVRTRFYDDFLAAACLEGCQQVVLLAAGLDSRAFRLEWPPAVRLFELDLPELLAFKHAVLADEGATPRCTRVTVSIDLRADWPAALVEAGFDTSRQTAWTAEGLLAYLTDADAARLLGQVGDLSGPRSQLALESARIADDSTLTEANALPALDQIATLWEGGLHQDAAGWLRDHGWRVEQHDRAALAERYRRPSADTSTGGFVTAVRL
jgi:methyltransferase (TIGR00027 family)